MVRVAVVGVGFVGRAVADVVSSDTCSIQLIDPKLPNGIDTASDVSGIRPDTEIAFVCVPTPAGRDGPNFDIADGVVQRIAELAPDALVVLKSTVLPDHAVRLYRSVGPDRFVYNPEFLTEANASADMVRSKFHVIGGSPETAARLVRFYRENTRLDVSAEYRVVSPEAASMMKYAVNAFLAAKVVFMNEIHGLCHRNGIDFDEVSSAMALDERIGRSHMLVPGPDGRFGFGGACFPKDTMALLWYASEIGARLDVLAAAVDVNDRIRLSYDSPLPREAEQGVF